VSVAIKVYATLVKYTTGEQVIEVDGSTVGQCLAQLVKKHPAMKQALFDENGKLLSYINVYVNGKRPYPKLLDKPTKGGDTILLAVALGGG
jgi:adenylyltransferase/sulfurtransferase